MIWITKLNAEAKRDLVAHSRSASNQLLPPVCDAFYFLPYVCLE